MRRCSPGDRYDRARHGNLHDDTWRGCFPGGGHQQGCQSVNHEQSRSPTRPGPACVEHPSGRRRVGRGLTRVTAKKTFVAMKAIPPLLAPILPAFPFPADRRRRYSSRRRRRCRKRESKTRGVKAGQAAAAKESRSRVAWGEPKGASSPRRPAAAGPPEGPPPPSCSHCRHHSPFACGEGVDALRYADAARGGGESGSVVCRGQAQSGW